ncbi:MAG: ABC transporter ATP-binding protein [Rhodanobacter sp.]|jgi:hypothetical protein|nr:ABC transporter ATP-binding protein [Rhodanobacter sp.]
MHNQDESPRATTAPAEPPPPGLLVEIGQFGRAFKQLFGAQLQLLAAELGLARSAVSWMLLAALAATMVGVGLTLSVLAFAGLLLATWFGSWLWALLVLCLLQLALLTAALVLFRRCMHWISLPVTRGEWGAMMHASVRRGDDRVDTGQAEQQEPSAP